MSYFQQMQMLDFFNENGVTHVNLSVLSCARDGNRKMKGDARARDRDEAVRSLAWAWNENRNGGEVYVRPARFLPDGKPAAWPMIFFDDVPLEIVPKIKKSALVIETSPKNFHVWMPLRRPLGENERRAEQVRIQPLLKSDPASTSGEHFGRLPGFLNHKRNRVMVRILKKVDGPLLVPSPAPGPAPTAPYSPPLKGGARVSDSSPRLTGSGASESEREFGYLIGRLGWFKAHGIPLNLEIARLKKRLVEQAERRGKRNPSEYARRSVEAALREIQGI